MFHFLQSRRVLHAQLGCLAQSLAQSILVFSPELSIPHASDGILPDPSSIFPESGPFMAAYSNAT